MKMLPVQRSALHVGGWAALTVLSFFFHFVAFGIVLLMLAMKTLEFRWLYENTKGFPYDADTTSDRSKPVYEQPIIPGTELGPERERSLRADLPEN